jgi:hypothetical protein
MNKNSSMLVGSSVSVITPKAAVDLGGSVQPDGTPRRSRKIHDDLYLKVVTFSSAKGHLDLLVISLDLIWLSKEYCRAQSKTICDKYGVSADQIMFAASHTHAGPETMDNFYGPQKSEVYLESLSGIILKTISAAVRTQSPADFYTQTITANLNVSRRKNIIDKSALKNFKLRVVAQNAINVSGHNDPVLTVLKVARQDKQDILLVNFAAHPIFFKSEESISKDWPGYIEQIWNQKTESDCLVVFFQGFCGDLLPAAYKINRPNNWSVSSIVECLLKPFKLTVTSPESQAREYASRIVDKIFDRNGQWERASIAGISCQSVNARLDFDMQCLPPNTGVAFRANTLEGYRDHIEKTKNDYFSNGQYLTLNHIDFGAFSILTCDAEMFSSYATYARDRSSKPIMIVGYCNGMIGYVPDRKALVEGGYEPFRSLPIFGLPAPFSTSIEETIKTSIRQLIKTDN